MYRGEWTSDIVLNVGPLSRTDQLCKFTQCYKSQLTVSLYPKDWQAGKRLS